jgi:S1-C subfamily serine protease
VLVFADAVAKLSASIFPIFYTSEHEGRPFIGVSGTGFFVDDSGLFVTVDHIMTCAPAGSTYYYYGNLPDRLAQPPVAVEWVASDPGRDVYLGSLGRPYGTAVEFAEEAVRPGDAVCLSGYPMAELSANPEGRFVANVRRYWQPTFVIDVTHAVVDERSYDGYIVRDPCISGMSGGPVFDQAGKVWGMAVATVTRTEPDLNGEPIMLRNGIVLNVEQIRTFVEEHRPISGNGIRRRAGVDAETPAHMRTQ